MTREGSTGSRPCDVVRALLALGEAVEDPRLQDHLRDCRSCRETAMTLARVKQGLASEAMLEPPEELDRIVRQALGDRPLVSGFLLRPGMAAGLAVAALFALIATVSTMLAQAGAAELGPLLGVAVVWIYLALCFAATVPLLLQGRLKRWGRGNGVST